MRVRVLLQIINDDGGSSDDAIEAAAFEKQTERAEDLGLSTPMAKR